MNPNISNMKMETDTFVCIICFAAFIGYTLGIQHAVTNVIKTQNMQQSNKVNKTTQTNLSELALLLTSNNMMVERQLLNNEVSYNLNTEKSNKENDVHKYNENVPENVPENVVNSSGGINSPEEEYEVITGSIKKLDTKKQPQYYFGWFDSMF